MNYKIVEKGNRRYIEIRQAINCKVDVLDIIGICISNDIKLLMLGEEVFTENFINLRSGITGIVLQKFINYHIKAIATVEDKDKIQGKFKELVNELNRGRDFRVFHNNKDAEKWILNTKDV